MLDVSVIESEIEALEAEEETTYEVCEQLACLYTVRDGLTRKKIERSHESSDFLTAAVGAPLPDLMRIMDEHMEAIKVIYPSEYDAIVRKIRSLHDPA